MIIVQDYDAVVVLSDKRNSGREWSAVVEKVGVSRGCYAAETRRSSKRKMQMNVSE